jgi:Ser/Thr protein kinase RdoA (MazF antagonist)
MPRYFFHVCNGDGFTQDEEGAILPDAAAARRNAIAAARGIMAEEMRAGQLNPASFIEIEDEEGKLLFTLQFSEAYEVRRKPAARL